MTQDWSIESERSKNADRADRRQAFLYAWIGLLVAAVIAGIVFAIFIGGREAGIRTHEARLECINQERVWVRGECLG